jgi:hypothetical protein
MALHHLTSLPLDIHHLTSLPLTRFTIYRVFDSLKPRTHPKTLNP